MRGPEREPFGAFKRVATWNPYGTTVRVVEVLVHPDAAMTAVADNGALYFVGPPPYDAGQGSGADEAISALDPLER